MMMFTTTFSKGIVTLPDFIARNAPEYCLGMSQYRMKEAPKDLLFLCVESVESSYCNGEYLPSLGPLHFREGIFERPMMVPFLNVVGRDIRIWMTGGEKIEGVVTLVLGEKRLSSPHCA